jgi:hypothetical protein
MFFSYERTSFFLYFIKEQHANKTQTVQQTNQITGASNKPDSISKNPIMICAFWHKMTIARPPSGPQAVVNLARSRLSGVGFFVR